MNLYKIAHFETKADKLNNLRTAIQGCRSKMRILPVAAAILVTSAMLNIASGATRTANVHLYCWNKAASSKKCTFDDMGQCEIYAEDAGGWCELNTSYPGPLPPLDPKPDSR